MNVLKAAADARNADDPIGYLRAMYGSQATQRLRNLKAAMTPHHQVRLTHGYVNDLLSPGKIDNLSKTLKICLLNFGRNFSITVMTRFW